MTSEFATFHASHLASAPSVLELRGTEVLCRPFRFDIHLRLTGGDADADDEEAIGASGTLTMQRGGEPFRVHGILSNVTLLAREADWSVYRVSLVPRLWRLGLTRHSRVFTNMSVPDILREVLEGGELTEGEDFELRLQGDYPEEEFVAQYAESKLDFLHRWMEREGIYYFFDHTGGAEKMVLCDNPSAHAKLIDKEVRYQSMGLGSASGDGSAQEVFDSFAVIRDAVVGAVKLSDYDYARPALDLSAEEGVSNRGFGQMTAHLGRFFDPAQARRYAKLRAEAIQAKEVTVHAAGNALHMSAGHLMSLAEHASSKLNQDYLITEVHHMANLLEGDLDGGLSRLIKPLTEDRYRVEVRGLQQGRPFRPEQRTRWPRVMGYESATIDGPADSDHAQLDPQGRYLVKMRFDESALEDGKRSTYVRMMQPHGGPTEGFHFPLRKGTEVKMGFDEGDPDRPFIAGVVPNMTTPSLINEQNFDENLIRTKGDNFIHLVDKGGFEFVDIGSPNDRTTIHLGYPRPTPGITKGLHEPNDFPAPPDASMSVTTDGSAAYRYGGSCYINVGGFQAEIVRGGVYESYSGGPHQTTVTGMRFETVTAGVFEDYTSRHDSTVTGTRLDSVTGAVTEKYGSQETTVKGFRHIIAGAGQAQSVTGWSNVEASAGIKLDAPSIHLHASDILLNAPSVTNMAAKDYWQAGETEYTGSKKTELAGFVFGATGLKVEVTGAKFENAAINLGKLAAAFCFKGSDNETAGPKTRTEAILAELAGLITFT